MCTVTLVCCPFIQVPTPQGLVVTDVMEKFKDTAGTVQGYTTARVLRCSIFTIVDHLFQIMSI